eukprot:CAMPEP_0116844762 /NCGR_PEP_ID=MMETSP0418-20121206/12882_1 /TAXON_ID=1158023 /ORGANISM="Astrosyne radiata, Strain 13vi08-1A" /LENGTH=570 /DNA_ID=CAMNT_0004475779 /DNA_START=875 /DNA_END=2588 /DNA_ORIENTATION=-
MSSDLSNCKDITLDFVIRDVDTEMQVVEDDIRSDLAKVGITVNTRSLTSAQYSDVAVLGGPSHVEYSAIVGLEPPLTRELLLSKIAEVQQVFDVQEIQTRWKEILNDVHQQALFLPLWGARVPYVLNRRLAGFTPGDQTWAFPVNTIRVVEGSKNVSIAPGGTGGLFKSVGPLNPHQYSPNEIFASDWVYEGLVSYGQDGEIVPSLATSWTTETISTGQRVTFELRPDVKFHDGSDWNCSVAVLNFDHVLSDIVRQRHQWYGVPQHLKSWTCNANGDLVLETSTPFYPLLQELTYIRPLRFASAEAFAQGFESHPDLHNACEPGKFGARWNHLEKNVTCLGLQHPSGTGPFKFVSREYLPGSNETIDAKVLFARNEDYWGLVPDIEFLEVRHFPDTDAVEAALKSGEVDMALGGGPLTPIQVQNLKFFHSDQFDVRHSGITQNAFLVFNTGKEPTNDIEVRRTIIHAVNKAAFVEKEFAGLEQPASQLLPLDAPFCNVDLNPKWNYDLEKATLLNCPEDDSLSGGAIAGIVIAAVVVIGLLAFVGKMIYSEKKGKPMFAPVEQVEKGEKA